MKNFIDTHTDKDGKLDYDYYISPDIEILIFGYSSGRSMIFIRKPEGYWIETTGKSGSSSGIKKTYTGENVFEEYSSGFRLWTMGDEGFYAEGTFNFSIIKKRVFKLTEDCSYRALPNRLIVSKIFKFGTDNIIITAREEFIRDYITHMWVGNSATGLRKQVITDHVSYRDGGTTYITTKEGLLFWPSPFPSKKAADSTWKILEEEIVS